LGFWGFGVLGKKGLNYKMGQNKPTPAYNQGSGAGGKMYLTSPQNTHVFNVGEEFVLELRVDTESQEVGGYDAVIKYDDHILEFIKADNLIPDFEMFTNELAFPGDSGKQVTVTGIMQLEKQKAFAFHQEPVARLTFRPKQAGVTSLSFDFTKGETNDSNLVLINTEEILSSVEDFRVIAGSAHTLKIGQTYTDPETKLTAKLKKITMPDDKCNDCTTDAEIEFGYQARKNESITFVNGGFDGKTVDTKKVFERTIEVRNITSQSLEISVIPD
jgi:hypothetical protein